MRFVPIGAVKEGAYLAKTIYDNDGRVLLKKGMPLTERLLKRIQNIDIYSIYINDEYSNNEIEDIIKPEIKQKAVSQIKKAFDNFHNYNLYLSKNSTSSSIDKDFLKSREKYLSSIKDLSKDILDQLLSKKDILINLVDIKSKDNYTYQHSVNVAILSIVLGIELQLSRTQLYDLCVGAMLHDVGKVFIPEDIINKNGPLTDSEFEIMKQHPLKGYEYLKSSIDISAPSRAIILQHHEKYNGEGYPKQFKKSEINTLAKVVAIADVYDALTSDRPYRRAASPNEAMEYIMGSGNTHFDYQMTKAFSTRIVPYPEGTLVRLSNNDIALVTKSNAYYPLRPQLKILWSEDSYRENTALDLMDEISVVIDTLQYEVPTKTQENT